MSGKLQKLAVTKPASTPAKTRHVPKSVAPVAPVLRQRGERAGGIEARQQLMTAALRLFSEKGFALRSAAFHHETRHQAANNATDSTAAATDTPTPRSTSSSSAGSAGTPPPRHTWPADSPKARPAKKSCAASSATSYARSTPPSPTTSTPPTSSPDHSNKLLDIHRSFGWPGDEVRLPSAAGRR